MAKYGGEASSGVDPTQAMGQATGEPRRQDPRPFRSSAQRSSRGGGRTARVLNFWTPSTCTDTRSFAGTHARAIGRTITSPSRRGRAGAIDYPTQVLLDLADRMLGQVLADLGDNPALHIGMERVPQLRQRPRRRRHDERIYLALAHQHFHCGSHALGEAVFFEVVPVGHLHAAAPVRVCPGESASGAVGTLLMSSTDCRRRRPVRS